MPPSKPIVACMKWGDRYGPEFANRLYRAVKRNMEQDFRFLCFTDDETGVLSEIESLPLPPINIPESVTATPWRKLSLWQSPLADIRSRDVLVLDLDLVITGPLQPFFDYHPGEYCVIENWTQKGRSIGNTSVFRIPVGRFEKIFSQFNETPDKVLNNFRIEQHYISANIPSQKFWPNEWCLSFKHSLLPRFPMNWIQTATLPASAKVIAFTGHPDPDEARDGLWPAPWYKRHYKSLRPVPWIKEHWR